MSSRGRGRLVQRSRVNDTASPASRRPQERASETPARQHPRQTELPTYEPPACPLSADAQQKLNALRNPQHTSKYQGHIKGAIVVLKASAVSANERLAIRKSELRSAQEKRQRDGKTDEDRDDDEIESENFTRQFEKKVPKITNTAELAVRELIDYGDELSIQESLMQDVADTIASAAPPPHTAPRRRRAAPAGSDDENDEEEEPETPAEDHDNVSAIEVLRRAREGYANNYKSKSLMSRYGDHNEFKAFKGAIHLAQTLNSGVDAPHSSTWFPEEDGTSGQSSNSRRRRNNTTDNTNNGGESSEDEIVITNTSQRLACPLTIKTIEVPVSSRKCKHSYEKHAIYEFIQQGARAYAGSNEKIIQCPQTGCVTMISLNDLYDDDLLLQKLKYAQMRNRERDDDDNAPRGTQPRPEEINEDDDDDAVDIDEEDQRAQAARIKRERARSRGLSLAPSQSQTAGADSDEEMD